jgi:MSHA biogenesis protein MshL
LWVEIQPPTSTNTGTGGGTTSNPPTVITSPFFSGIALDVTPQIDDQGNITLHMRPSVTTVTERPKTIDFGASGQFTIPYASSRVKESDSIVRVRDGMIVAIGGLMSESQSGNVDKVPELGDIPIFGHFFKQTGRSMRKRELVILLKPTLIQDDADWQQTTQEVQGRLPAFDPRPQPRQDW